METDEIEITPAMIEAGLTVEMIKAGLSKWEETSERRPLMLWADGPILAGIYLAMRRASPKRRDERP